MKIEHCVKEIRRYWLYGVREVASSFFGVEGLSVNEINEDGLIQITCQGWEAGARWEIGWNVGHKSARLYVVFVAPSFSLDSLQYINLDEKPLGGINYEKILYVFKCGLVYYLYKLMKTDKRITGLKLKAGAIYPCNSKLKKVSKHLPYLPLVKLSSKGKVDGIVYFHPSPIENPIVYAEVKVGDNPVIEFKKSFSTYESLAEYIATLKMVSSAYSL